MTIARTKKLVEDEEKIARLAQGVGGPKTPITLLRCVESDDDSEDDKGAVEVGISRVGGPGFDLGERQPKYEGEPMTHIFTLAVRDVPALAAAYSSAAAVALYVSNPELNDAYTPYNDETAVVALTQEDLARGLAAPTARDLSLQPVQTATVEVPASVFDDEYGGGDEDDGGEDAESDEGEGGEARKALRQAVYGLAGRAGGAPIWLQSEEEGGRFLLQFDEAFASINLGDCGVMYVFDDTAYWQCH